MSEVKNIIISIIIFLLWSAGMFGFGYILSNRQATERINRANQQLAEQQQRYEALIRESEERISNIRKELFGTISNNEKATTELKGIIKQIRKQRINIQI